MREYHVTANPLLFTSLHIHIRSVHALSPSSWTVTQSNPLHDSPPHPPLATGLASLCPIMNLFPSVLVTHLAWVLLLPFIRVSLFMLLVP